MKLVLLPGMDGTGDLFEPLLMALPARLTPVVVRYPTDRSLTYRELESYVRPELPTSEPYAILGESFSGPIAIALAASHPNSLVSLILCCSFARNPYPKLAALRTLVQVLPRSGHLIPLMLSSFLLLGSDATEERQLLLESALAKVAPEVLRARLRELLTVDATRQLESVGVPVLYLRATNDRAVPKSALAEIQRLVPQVQAVDVDGPHCLLQVNPKAAAVAIDRFLPEGANAL